MMGNAVDAKTGVANKAGKNKRKLKQAYFAKVAPKEE